MAESLLHFAVPFAILAILGINLKKGFVVSLMALLPDFDIPLYVHRCYFHSLIMIMAIMLPIILITKRMRRCEDLSILITIVLLSHLVLDIFGGSIPVFWPILNMNVGVDTQLLFHYPQISNSYPQIQIHIEPAVFKSFQTFDAPLFTSGGVAVTALLIAPVLAKIFIDRFKKQQAKF